MQQLTGYFAKIKSLLAVKQHSRKTIAAVLAKYNIVVPEESLVVRDQVLRCAISPIQRSCIFMHKEAIMVDLNQCLPSVVRRIECC